MEEQTRHSAPASVGGLNGARQVGPDVNGVLARAAELFLVPHSAEAPEAVAPPAVRAVVLGAPADAHPLAAAVALSLRAAAGSPVAAVAVWEPGGAEAARASAATRAAARLAGRLTAIGLVAAARGRLACAALPPDPTEAADAIRRASPLVDGPLVTSLAGARPEALEILVAEHDVAIVAADPETALARAALAGLTARGIAASARRPPSRGVIRALATTGIAAPGVEAPRLDPCADREDG